ncbi:transposon Tf2-6 polyprotein [Trichonephila clavipes]|uniref:Transposon Tf2-6 polyprotein n=1 Tax=Trichonephila clavipes TaxID=2585209 RepID=A0A8X6WIL6_TRICX|nr:transposon Tf2-6 polyprotein [Trichonephila clavipes]
MRKDIKNRVRACEKCQRAKTGIPGGPEVIPTEDMLAKTTARALLNGWISRFGTPVTITNDQGTNFESSLMRDLTNMMGSHRIHSASYHPQSNGMIERFHRHLKSAIIAHEDTGWSDILPIVLLGLRSAMKNDLKATSSELVYGTTLRLPSGLISSKSLQTSVTPTYVSKLITMMRKLSLISPDYHCCTKSYVHQSLDRLGKGEGSTAIGKHLNLGESTVRAIKKNEAAIRKSVISVTKLSTKFASYTRDVLLERTERAIVIWIEEQVQRRIPVSGYLIQEKALQFYKSMKQSEPSTSTSQTGKEFSASKGWLTRFLKRNALHNIKISGESVRQQTKEQQKFFQRS